MGSTPRALSASRAAGIVGASRFATPVGVWLDIMEERNPGFAEAHGLKHEPFEGNAATRWGLAFEPALIHIAGGARGDVIIDRELALSHPDFDFITCHLDGVYLNGGEIHEGKTTTTMGWRDNWGEPGTDRIPPEYQVQVQLQMAISGRNRAVVSVLCFPERPETWEEMGLGAAVVANDTGVITRDGLAFALASDWARVFREVGWFHQYTVDASGEAQAEIVEALVAFWNRYLLTEMPPPARTYEDCRRLFVAPKGTVLADDDTERLAAEYRQINTEESAFRKRKEQIKAEIVKRMAAAAEHPIDGDSTEKWILRGASGAKLATYDGKVFR